MADNKESWYNELINSFLNKKWIAIPLFIVVVYLGISNIFKTTVENKENYDKIVNKDNVKTDKPATTSIQQNNGVIIIEPKGNVNINNPVPSPYLDKGKKNKSVIKEVPIESSKTSNSGTIVAKKPKNEDNITDIELPYIEATGVSIIDKSKPNIQAIELAKLGANAVAKANLLALIKGTYIKQETEIIDLSSTSSKLSAKIEGLILGAEEVGEPKINSEKVEVRLRVYKKNLPKQQQ
jgi:hypothetical protein